MINYHLENFINIHEGESVILFCTGSTANKFKFLDEFKDCKLAGVNRSIFLPYLKYRQLDYWFIADPKYSFLGVFDHISVYNNYRPNYNLFKSWNDLTLAGEPTMSDEWIQCSNPTSVPYKYLTLPYQTNTQGKYSYKSEDIELLRDYSFSSDVSKEPIYGCSSIIFIAFQFLLSLGFSKIYVVGNDFVGLHFHQYNFYGNYTHIFELGYFSERFKYFKEWKDNTYPEVDIISINPVLVDVFSNMEIR